MNDGPPAKRSDTQSPFAVLSPEVVRGQTGTRVKITESAADDLPLDTAPLTPSIPPESLKKPFASLTPKKPTPSLTPPPAGAAPPPPPSQLFAETASMRPPTGSSPSRSAPARRESPTATAATSSSRYGTCKEHGTALTSEGKCVLCAREKAKHDARTTKRILALLAIIVLGAAAYVVLGVMPN